MRISLLRLSLDGLKRGKNGMQLERHVQIHCVQTPPTV